MADKSVEIVVLRDSKGNYYALPKSALEGARVPDEHREELEKIIQQGGGASGALEDEQLESVVGGATTLGGISSVGTYQAPSLLTFDGLKDTWGSAG